MTAPGWRWQCRPKLYNLTFRLSIEGGYVYPKLLRRCVYPVSILTCRYVETEQVDCQLQERMIGLIPIQETSIINLKETYVASEVHEKRRHDRETIDRKVYMLILNGNSGTVDLGSFDEFGGVFVEQTVDKIDDFLLSHTVEPLRIWQATWVPLLLGSFFFLVAVLMLYVAVDSLIRLGRGPSVSRQT